MQQNKISLRLAEVLIAAAGAFVPDANAADASLACAMWKIRIDARSPVERAKWRSPECHRTCDTSRDI